MWKNCGRPRTGIICQEKCCKELLKMQKSVPIIGINRKLRFRPKKVKRVKNSGINGSRLWKEWEIIIKILIKILKVLITWKKTCSGFKNHFAKCFVNSDDNFNLKNKFLDDFEKYFSPEKWGDDDVF